MYNKNSKILHMKEAAIGVQNSNYFRFPTCLSDLVCWLIVKTYEA